VNQILRSCSNFTTSGTHAAADNNSAQCDAERSGEQFPAIGSVFNVSANSDNSKSPQDAAIRYEPAAAVLPTKLPTNQKRNQTHNEQH
jgi:hypothetical protein